MRVFFLLSLITLTHFCTAQKTFNVDSLLQSVAGKEDTATVNKINTWVRVTSRAGDYVAMSRLAKENIKLASKINYPFGKATALIYLAQDELYSNLTDFPTHINEAETIAHQIKDNKFLYQVKTCWGIYYAAQDNAKSTTYFQEALQYARKIDNKADMATVLVNLGVNYQEQNNYSVALDDFYIARNFYEITKDTNQVPYILNNIGIIHNERQETEQAIAYYKESIKIKQQQGNKDIVAELQNIGEAYYQIKNYDAALEVFLKEEKLLEEYGNEGYLVSVYTGLANVYLAQKKPALALEYARKSEKIATELKDENLKSEAYYAIASACENIKKYGIAQEYATKALVLSQKNNNLGVISKSALLLSDIYTATGNSKNALDYFKIHLSARDSILSKEKTRELLQSEMNYQFDKKTVQQRLDLEHQKTVRNFLILGLLATLLLAGLYYRQYRFKRKANLDLEEKNILISEARQQSEALLLNILPASIAEELKEKGNAEAKLYESATVLFTDIKDFTKHSEALAPQQLVAELDLMFRYFDSLLAKYPVEKIKTIGDAYICTGGLPIVNNTHAFDVVLMAKEMQSFMSNLKKERDAKGEICFEIRIGIHTGPLVAGIVGAKKFAYDVWGDTVNVAARMEQSCEEGKINISQKTYNLIKDTMPCTYRGKIDAKNKGLIDMYYVL